MFVFAVKIAKGKNVDPSNRNSGNSEVVSSVNHRDCWEWNIGLKRKKLVHWSMLEPMNIVQKGRKSDDWNAQENDMVIAT